MNRDTTEFERIDDRFQITNPGLKREVGHGAVREAHTAPVVPDERMACRKGVDGRPQYRAFHFKLKMAEPALGAHQRRPFARSGVGDTHAIRGSTESDLLFHRLAPSSHDVNRVLDARFHDESSVLDHAMNRPAV